MLGSTWRFRLRRLLGILSILVVSTGLVLSLKACGGSGGSPVSVVPEDVDLLSAAVVEDPSFFSLVALTSSNYSENFDGSLASTGTTDDSLPDGWAFLETGTNANLTYGVNNGSSNAGNTYSYGATDSSERAFGGLLSGSLTPTIGVEFTNSTGFPITQLGVTYTGEQWRLGTAGRADRIDFQYSLDAIALDNGTWINVDALDFSTPNQTTTGAKDGNAAENRTIISNTIPNLNIANSSTFWFRWQDFNAPGADDGLAVDDFMLVLNGPAPSPSPGPTPSPSPSPSAAPVTRIFTIQDAQQVSPLVGQSVTTTGVVTAKTNNGFYLQDPDGDNNVNTSDAIFVFTTTNSLTLGQVDVGNQITLDGTVSEFTPGGASTGNLSTTQLSSPSNIVVDNSSVMLPAPIIIGQGGRIPPTQVINTGGDIFGSANYDPDTDGIDFFESLEGMRVTAQNAVAVAGTNRFGEIFTVVDNGTGATTLNSRGALPISSTDFNPEKVQIQRDSNILPSFTTFPEVDTGSQLGNVTGVISYGFGNFEILPTEAFSATPSSLTAETSTLISGSDRLLIASFNVLNLDPNDQDGDTDIADGRFAAIGSQIANNLNAPDIVCLQEIQDNNGSDNNGVIAADETLQTLITSITDAGGPTYLAIDNPAVINNGGGGQPGGNIRTAYLYNPLRVQLVANSVGSVDTTGNFVTGPTNFFGTRPPLVAEFTFNSQNILGVCNHFSSKGGSAPILGVQQPFEQRQEDPTVNGSVDGRRDQSAAVGTFVSNRSNPNTVVLGDFNEFEFVSPLTNLQSNGLTNLIDNLPVSERYSFIFQGNSQQIDHILVTNNLLSGAQVDNVHTNIEFVDNNQRATDHDPVLATLTVETPPSACETAPMLLSTIPRNGEVRVRRDTQVQLTYDQPIAKGTGSIILRRRFLPFLDTRTTDINSSRVTIEGNDLILTVSGRGTQLNRLSLYDFSLPAGAVTCESGGVAAGSVNFSFVTGFN
ncbi:MAG: endonuclease/exonuclease/phosphatase family protein [Cyanophyceae cyanobacterium]